MTGLCSIEWALHLGGEWTDRQVSGQEEQRSFEFELIFTGKLAAQHICASASPNDA